MSLINRSRWRKRRMKNSAVVVIDLQNDITKNYREIIERVNQAIDWAVSRERYVVFYEYDKRNPA